MQAFIPENAKNEDFFFYFEKSDSFEIPPGHKILLKSVVEYVKNITDLNGINYFNVQEVFQHSLLAIQNSVLTTLFHSFP